jgi:hypothetical protein
MELLREIEGAVNGAIIKSVAIVLLLLLPLQQSEEREQEDSE